MNDQLAAARDLPNQLEQRRWDGGVRFVVQGSMRAPVVNGSVTLEPGWRADVFVDNKTEARVRPGGQLAPSVAARPGSAVRWRDPSGATGMTTSTSLSVADLLATSVPFSHWLQSRDRNEIIGQCGMPGLCPVAMWLLDAGVDTPSVGADDVEFYVGRKFQRSSSPEWLRRFVRAVDSMFPRSTYGQHPRITAEEALAVLEAVCADLTLVRGAA